MTLREWEQTNTWLTAHKTSKREIADLLNVVERDLHQSGLKDISPDWRMAIAYNAALQAATAALAAAGYRPARGGDHHYRVIQSLALTIGWPESEMNKLNAFRKKRNISSYERAGSVSDAEAREMQDLASRLRDDVRAWLKGNHSDLLSRA